MNVFDIDYEIFSIFLIVIVGLLFLSMLNSNIVISIKSIEKNVSNAIDNKVDINPKEIKQSITEWE